MKKIFTFAILLTVSSVSYAEQWQILGTRPMGMGGAFVEHLQHGGLQGCLQALRHLRSESGQIGRHGLSVLSVLRWRAM